MSFKTSLFTIFVVAVISGATLFQVQRSTTMTGAAVEKIVPSAGASATAALPTSTEMDKAIHDYIMANPKVILASIDALQKQVERGAYAAALEKNKEALFQDAASPSMGPADADAIVVEFMDYNCHFCKEALPSVRKLLDADKKVRVIFKEFPILGESSDEAAKWALAAHKQGKYFEYHSALMSNRMPVSTDLLEQTARSLGMNVDQAKVDAASAEIAAQISKNKELAAEMNITGTPGFVIGDEVVAGAVPVETIIKKLTDYRAGKKAQ